MNREEIMCILPHREDMLLLDEAELIDGISHGKYYVRGDEWFLRGHFPGNPVVPGVILCEILAQSACALLSGVSSPGSLTYYTGIDKAKFKVPVKPGDTIETKCELIKSRAPFYFAKGSANVNGKLCVSAEFSFAVIR